MTRLTDDWVTRPATRAVMDMLVNAGHEAWFVGGCVRNALIGAPVSDIDISTNALPERVMELAAIAGLNAVPTGIEHGTVTVVSDHIPHEITTYRHDVETDGRRAVVAFADNMHDDAIRRDFTMNALYADRDGVVVDPIGTGIADLTARHLRFIEDPAQRIREDYLRILRFFRFHAWYGREDLDADGLAACAEHADGIDGLSAERIGAEMLKLLAAPDPAPAVAAMEQAGVLAHALPGATARNLPILIYLEAGRAPDAIRRLAIIGGMNPKDRLRLSRADANVLSELRAGMGGGEPAHELGYRHGVDRAMDILLLRAALFEQPLAVGVEAAVEKGARAIFPVKAADLMPAYQGPELGAKLKALETRWIKSEFSLTRSELLP